ncbi:MAG: ABC transporter ATP-binding protein [Candidatus Margulisbacteria bacterium]|nr:ABC transporter ATP-binding protein [Candidatus Margulisiibacteriota bacterium]
MNTHPILNVTDLGFSFGTKSVIEKVNFSVSKNEFLAIIGPNGGGKTTLLKLILGLLKPTSGTIKVFGVTPEKGRSKVGYLAQSHRIDMDYPVTVCEIVLMSRLLGNPFYRYNQEDHDHAHDLLDQLGVGDLKERAVKDLSGGERQRVFLARALMKRPQLLLLDEPTTGIDRPTEKDFYALLGELNQQMAIVIISHDVSAVSKWVHRVGCLNKKIVFHDQSQVSDFDLQQMYQHDVRVIGPHDHD